MYIYHALINALSAHMIHINLNDILYTCRAESYRNNLHKILYGKTNKHTRLFVCFKPFCLDQVILLHQVNSAMGLACVLFSIHLQRLLWMYSPGNARVKGNDRTDRLTGKVTIASGLRVGRSEVLRCLRHYLLAQSQGHHTIDHLEEKRKVTLPENLKDFKRFKLTPSLYLFIY